MAYLGLQSVRHGNSGACIEDIFRLHFPEAQLAADLTWGNGRFWKWPSDICQPSIVTLDAVVRDGIHVQSDYRQIPLRHRSVDVAIFDPPFIFSPGLRGIIGADRGFRGGPGPYNASDLELHTAQAMTQMRYVARQGMILKGQDLITGQHPNWWTYQVMNQGQKLLSIWPEDILVQVSSAARMIDPRWKNQYHFRRAHSYYIIYKWED